MADRGEKLLKRQAGSSLTVGGKLSGCLRKGDAVLGTHQKAIRKEVIQRCPESGMVGRGVAGAHLMLKIEFRKWSVRRKGGQHRRAHDAFPGGVWYFEGATVKCILNDEGSDLGVVLGR